MNNLLDACILTLPCFGDRVRDGSATDDEVEAYEVLKETIAEAEATPPQNLHVEITVEGGVVSNVAASPGIGVTLMDFDNDPDGKVGPIDYPTSPWPETVPEEKREDNG